MQQFKEATEFLSLLNQHHVEYLIIGGVAVNIHGYTRATGDLDIWYNFTPENFESLLKAIRAFGFDITPLKNVQEKSFIRIPVDIFFIELLAIIDGKLNFSESYQKAYPFNFNVYLLSVMKTSFRTK